MKKFIIFLLLVVVIGGGFYWYGQNQEPPIDFRLDELLAPPAAADYYEDSNTLTVNRGSATVKRSTDDEEEVTTETTVGIGDTIVVNEDSLVTIQWFDDSISRLQAGTELTIDEASFNPENITETDINLNVISGEVWSKVKNLVDEDSEFLTYSGQVVAGVRGSTINFKVTDEGVIIESIEHAAMIGKRDPETKEITPNIYIIEGKQAKAEEGGIEVNKISEERLNNEWFKNNQANDKKAAGKIIQKNLERMQKRAGLLPGEEGYERKMRLIQKRLEEIDNPEARAEMEVRLAQMKLNEALALLLNNPNANPQEITQSLKQIKESLNLSSLPKATQKKLKHQIETELKALMRSMEELLPYEKLNRLNELMRSNHMSMKEDDAHKDQLQKKQLESRLYELMDAIHNNEISPERISEFLLNYRSELEALGKKLEKWEDLKSIALQFLKELEKMEGVELDADKMQSFKEMLGEKSEPEPAPVVRTAPKPTVVAPVIVRPPEPEPTKETPEVIKEEAPFHQGPSDV